MTDRSEWSESTIATEIELFRAAALGLRQALSAAGFEESAQMMRHALDTRSGRAEWLLAVREAMVVTRQDWVQINEARVKAAAALHQAKRLAIEM